ncbi:hypothetical protein K2173_026157 [Erythroxylum novogranatense]|uniref:BHLH domain-containing protein n=1 Tax=Erythroxylum novogranatense TaxID=1862640 RepID=A0AAV8T8X7_9ROSI|nr:hypothetical protein K2173_026157 [Erythroxylum novogranatense]
MEINHPKSAPEDQVEMMMMDKFPECYASGGGYGDVVDHLSSSQFPGASNSSITVGANGVRHFHNNRGVGSSPPYVDLPSNISFANNGSPSQQQPPSGFLSSPNSERWRTPEELSGAEAYSSPSQKKNSMAAMREMIFRVAALQPIHIDPESVKPPKRRNVKISKDPQSVAARHRRERISERIRILQRLVPGGTKMDTASMLDEAIHYVKFLKTQVQSLERAQANNRPTGIGFPVAMSSGSNYLPLGKTYQPPSQNIQFHQYGDA